MNRTLTKNDITASIREQTSLSWVVASALLDAALELVKDELASGGTVKVSGFGAFVVRSKRARRGRNPQTAEAITIVARRVLSFKPSLVFRQALNRSKGFE